MIPAILPLEAFRDFDFELRLTIIEGLSEFNFAGAAPFFRILQYPEQAGAALYSAPVTTTRGAEGIFVESASALEIFIPAATIDLLPAAPEAGGETRFYHLLGVAVAGRSVPVFAGAFTIQPRRFWQ